MGSSFAAGDPGTAAERPALPIHFWIDCRRGLRCLAPGSALLPLFDLRAGRFSPEAGTRVASVLFAGRRAGDCRVGAGGDKPGRPQWTWLRPSTRLACNVGALVILRFIFKTNSYVFVLVADSARGAHYETVAQIANITIIATLASVAL